MTCYKAASTAPSPPLLLTAPSFTMAHTQAKFDRIVLESLQISGGGQMEITGLNVRVRGLE